MRRLPTAVSASASELAMAPFFSRLAPFCFLIIGILGCFSCSNAVGTLEIQIQGDEALLASVYRAEVFTDDPRHQEEAVRDESGELFIALSFPSKVAVTTIQVRGFDRDDELIATGMSAPISIAAVDAVITIEMTAVMSIH